MLFIGVDLGTSACKLLLMDDSGSILKVVSKSYAVEYPHPGWSQQNPEDWWTAVRTGIPELLGGIDSTQVRGIGCGGQMHGLVVLDQKDRVIRPAILWNDGRTVNQVHELNETFGKERLLACTGNIAYAGFTAPKLLWMRQHEPERFGRIAHVMLPKDFIVHRLTGEYATDVSDASGTLLFDVAHRCWSPEMLQLCDLAEAQLPQVYESYQKVGDVLPGIASELGLKGAVAVAAGAGDNAAAAVGTGAVGEGSMNISLGTSGTVFIPTHEFVSGVGDRIHSFCHADGRWHLMGCILSAASCNSWWVNDVLQTGDFAGEQAGISASEVSKGLPYFLPYLMGERTPHNDTEARGAFVGMSMSTTRADITRAVLEGVGFAVRDSVQIARDLGCKVTSSTVCGGGAKSSLWLQMIANTLNLDLELPQTEQGPGLGGAMLAGVASGRYASVEDCARELVRIKRIVHPDPDAVPHYEERYQVWRGLYPALRASFHEMGA